MKIDLNGLNPNDPNLDRTTLRHTHQPELAKADSVENVADQDAASLSLNTPDIQALDAQALTVPEIRADKVNALRQAIASGQYKVEPDKIAEAMIQDYSGDQISKTS